MLPTERGPHSTNSTFVVLANTAKLKPVSKWTSFLCFDVQIGRNTMASQRKISSKAVGVHFSWIMIASIKLMTQTMDGCLFYIKWGGGEWKCVREWWQHCNVNCQNVSIFSGFSCPTPTLLLLAPILLGLRNATHLDLLGMERVKKRGAIHGEPDIILRHWICANLRVSSVVMAAVCCDTERLAWSSVWKFFVLTWRPYPCIVRCCCGWWCIAGKVELY